MESTPTASPIVRIQQLPAYQTGGQQQQQFVQGQLLQGSVSAKNAPGQFTIDINGQQILAESTAQLSVGQKLDLQVAALAPRIELRIVDNPITRFLGSAIHQLSEQAESFPALAALAAKADQLALLNPSSRETLQRYAEALASLPQSIPQANTSSAAAANNALLDKALALVLNPVGNQTALIQQEIGALLSELSLSAQLPPEKQQLAQGLAQFFANSAFSGQPAAELQQAGIPFPNLAISQQEATQLLARIAQMFPGQPGPQNLAAAFIASLLQPTGSSPLTPLQSLFAFLAQTTPAPAPPAVIHGQTLQEIMNRLGTNMERLFAEGKPEEAAKTLKYALLDLHQQLPANEKTGHKADQLVQTIESYQLLQLRLASESLVFLPLPLPFLKQGYLLINPEQTKQQADQQEDSPAATYELHVQLEGLGNISVTFDQRQEGLSLKFMAEDAGRARFLAGFRDELSQQITAAPLTSVQFLVGAQEPIKTLYEKITQSLSGMLDTTA